MLKNNVCPSFEIKSLTFIFLLVNTFLYLTLLLFGGCQQNSLTFLAVNEETLIEFGENSPYFIRFHFELFRLLMSLFLTNGSLLFLTNNIPLMMLGSFYEFTTNSKVMGMVYIFSGVVGEILSNLFSDYPTVGNLPSLMGLIGGILSKIFYVGLNNEVGRRREMIILIILILLIIVMVVLMCPLYWALNLIGGFLCGLCLGFIAVINNQERGRFKQYTKVFCWSFLIIFINVGLLLFFLTRRPVFYEVGV